MKFYLIQVQSMALKEGMDTTWQNGVGMLDRQSDEGSVSHPWKRWKVGKGRKESNSLPSWEHTSQNIIGAEGSEAGVAVDRLLKTMEFSSNEFSQSTKPWCFCTGTFAGRKLTTVDKSSLKICLNLVFPVLNFILT